MIYLSLYCGNEKNPSFIWPKPIKIYNFPKIYFNENDKKKILKALKSAYNYLFDNFAFHVNIDTLDISVYNSLLSKNNKERHTLVITLMLSEKFELSIFCSKYQNNNIKIVQYLYNNDFDCLKNYHNSLFYKNTKLYIHNMLNNEYKIFLENKDIILNNILLNVLV